MNTLTLVADGVTLNKWMRSHTCRTVQDATSSVGWDWLVHWLDLPKSSLAVAWMIDDHALVYLRVAGRTYRRLYGNGDPEAIGALMDQDWLVRASYREHRARERDHFVRAIGDAASLVPGTTIQQALSACAPHLLDDVPDWLLRSVVTVADCDYYADYRDTLSGAVVWEGVDHE